jgi:hypothetical protein
MKGQRTKKASKDDVVVIKMLSTRPWRQEAKDLDHVIYILHVMNIYKVK